MVGSNCACRGGGGGGGRIEVNTAACFRCVGGTGGVRVGVGGNGKGGRTLRYRIECKSSSSVLPFCSKSAFNLFVPGQLLLVVRGIKVGAALGCVSPVMKADVAARLASECARWSKIVLLLFGEDGFANASLTEAANGDLCDTPPNCAIF